MAVRALRDVVIPALAMDTVYTPRTCMRTSTHTDVGVIINIIIAIAIATSSSS
jgi:hypothetical protein